MTFADIEQRELTAGRELDALIAEKVMGDQRLDPPHVVGARSFEWKHRGELMEDPPYYSADIAAAWLVVENLADRGWKVDVQNRYRPCWACHINFPAPDYRHVFETAEGEHAAATAICLAALKAVLP